MRRCVLLSHRRKRKKTAISDKQNSNMCLRLIEPQEDGCEQSRTAAFKGRMKGVFSMNRGFGTRRAARCWFALVLLSWAAGIGIASAQTGAPMEAPATLNALDFNFVGQAN